MVYHVYTRQVYNVPCSALYKLLRRLLSMLRDLSKVASIIDRMRDVDCAVSTVLAIVHLSGLGTIKVMSVRTHVYTCVFAACKCAYAYVHIYVCVSGQVVHVPMCTYTYLFIFIYLLIEHLSLSNYLLVCSNNIDFVNTLFNEVHLCIADNIIIYIYIFFLY